MTMERIFLRDNIKLNADIMTVYAGLINDAIEVLLEDTNLYEIMADYIQNNTDLYTVHTDELIRYIVNWAIDENDVYYCNEDNSLAQLANYAFNYPIIKKAMMWDSELVGRLIPIIQDMAWEQFHMGISPLR